MIGGKDEARGVAAAAPPIKVQQQETTPLVPASDKSATSAEALVTKALAVIGASASYISFSAGLITVNKRLMRSNDFPYPLHLVMLHALFSAVVAFTAYLVKPSLFPSLSDPTRRISVDRELILKNAVPIAVLFSAELVLGNWAYMYSSVPFLQMMKEGNLVIIYLLSLLAGLEIFATDKAFVLFLVLLATMLSVEGEVHFSLLGFQIQGASQVFGCTKMTLQTLLLSRAGQKLDTFTYVLLIMPLCFVILAGLACVQLFLWEDMTTYGSPQLADIFAYRWPILTSAMLALALNVAIAVLLQLASAVGFVLVGIIKDGCIVVGGAALFREYISGQQKLGFVLQTLLILLYSLMKIFPAEYERLIFVRLDWFMQKSKGSAGASGPTLANTFEDQLEAHGGSKSV